MYLRAVISVEKGRNYYEKFNFIIIRNRCI